ncbi:MAG: hypothetical protein O3A10_10010 [Chloroflexi bacterium]|nr:hypothetical protein [Chloroflexota bacterium]MDA1147543.1 hypothetical protein [Chloroflexota bacterium]
MINARVSISTRLLALALTALVVSFAAACGGGDGDAPPPDGDPGNGSAGSGGAAPSDRGGSGGSPNVGGGGGGAPSMTLEEAVAAGQTTVLRRTTILDTDPLGIAGPAFTLLVPEGWTAAGGPVWRHQYSNLVTFEGGVSSPDGFHGVQFFPIFPQIWQDGGIPFFPEGTTYLGNDVRPPIRDAALFLETLILPNYRAAFAPRIIAREALPDVAALYVARTLPGTDVIAERLLTEHNANGVTMYEEFTIVLSFTPNPGIPGALIWSPEQIFALRAPAADFDEARPVLHAIASSVAINLEWFAGYQYALGLSVQNGFDAIKAAGEASRIISQSNAEISDIIMNTYNESQASSDRINDAFSQTIRGVDTFVDPFDGGTFELPNEFNYAYGFEDGKVILTNEPGLDPKDLFPGEVFQLLEVSR